MHFIQMYKLSLYYDSPNHVFDAIHIESNRKPKVNHYLIHSCPLNSQALSRDLGDKKYPWISIGGNRVKNTVV